MMQLELPFVFVGVNDYEIIGYEDFTKRGDRGFYLLYWSNTQRYYAGSTTRAYKKRNHEYQTTVRNCFFERHWKKHGPPDIVIVIPIENKNQTEPFEQTWLDLFGVGSPLHDVLFCLNTSSSSRTCVLPTDRRIEINRRVAKKRWEGYVPGSVVRENARKFNATQIHEVRHLLALGDLSQPEIARKFSCCTGTINSISTGKKIYGKNNTEDLRTSRRHRLSLSVALTIKDVVDLYKAGLDPVAIGVQIGKPSKIVWRYLRKVVTITEAKRREWQNHHNKKHYHKGLGSMTLEQNRQRIAKGQATHKKNGTGFYGRTYEQCAEMGRQNYHKGLGSMTDEQKQAAYKKSAEMSKKIGILRRIITGNYQTPAQRRASAETARKAAKERRMFSCDQIREIRRLKAETGLTQKTLAKMYNCSKGNIKHILRGRSYQDC